jgi:hypothetical protein
VVVLLIFFGYNAIQHASDPFKNEPAGGAHGFDRAVRVLGLFFGMLTAILPYRVSAAAPPQAPRRSSTTLQRPLWAR